jgi:thiosulfate/3-mercaptopyruvate sulfurtransferase
MKQLIRLFSCFALLCVAAPLRAVELSGPLVEPQWLADKLDQVVILDVRKDTASFTRQTTMKKDKKTGKLSIISLGGHIPGARLVSYKKVRATVTIDGKEVTRMLPAQADFEALMQRAGVSKDSVVIIASKGMSGNDLTMAARLYWQLKYFGHDKVAILNGGVAQWFLEGREMTLAASEPAKGDWTATAAREEMLATSADVAAAVDKGGVQLIDYRPVSAYMGTWKKSYVYDKGHIPGAKVFPNDLMTIVAVPARFPSADMLADLYKGMKLDASADSIAYCNSGQLAAGGWFIQHELLGNGRTRLYDGSMHQWTMEERPVKAMVME